MAILLGLQFKEKPGVRLSEVPAFC